jgi:DNA invertase Pin-like site-specific DNA recombinase
MMRKTPQAGGSGLTVALLYTRVSSDEQARDGISLDVQLREGRQYIARQPDWVIGGEYQDVMSGSRDDRPDYQRLLAEARRLRAEAQAAAVVVMRLDRFGRKVLERVQRRAELKALGVATHSVREGGEVSDFMANLLASVAEEEVRQLGERTSAAKQHLLATGWFPGGRVPWGYVLRDATSAERAQGAPLRVLDVDPLVVPYVVEAYRRLVAGATLRAVARWVFALPEPVRAGRMLA